MMRVFVTGTDTGVGKTTICSWLCLHSNYAYFKPIQTGNAESEDKTIVSQLSNAEIYAESYTFTQPFSPHLAARLDNGYIDMNKVVLPQEENLIIEGAGGVMVPLNEKYFIIDLIRMLQVPVILVARSTLGTINHTLLTIEALKRCNISILGVILNGEYNEENKRAIEFYGQIPVLASFPKLKLISLDSLRNVEFSKELKSAFGI